MTLLGEKMAVERYEINSENWAGCTNDGNKKHCIFMGCCAMLSVVNRVILNHLMTAPNTINLRLRETMVYNCERLC